MGSLSSRRSIVAPIVDKSSAGSDDRCARTALVKGLISFFDSVLVGIVLGAP